MQLTAQLVSVQVGRPQTCEAQADSAAWTSAIFKCAVSGTITVGTNGLLGDEQADTVNHGGPDKAICAYASEHFGFWNDQYPDHSFGPGGFGENFTLHGLVEDQVHIGDVFTVGSCVLQISQPRQPCWKLSRRWGISEFAVDVQNSRRTGWYFRVLQPGTCHAGDILSLTESPHPEWSITRANDIMFARPRVSADDVDLAACPALSDAWRQSLTKRAT